MNRTRRGILLPIVSVVLAATVPGGVAAECDPNADWTVYQPTGEISDIIIQGSRAWIAANGGIIRADLGVEFVVAEVDGFS